MNSHHHQKLIIIFILLLLMMPVKILAEPKSTADQQLSKQTPLNAGTVVVTLKPLYSLVAHLTEGILTPELLIKQTPSSHHYHLRPSERGLLANASLIIWFGPAMESYLEKIISELNHSSTGNAMVISALQADNLHLLNKRSKNLQKKDADRQLIPQQQTTGQLKSIDPHIWLSTHNAVAISKHVTRSLKAFDPQNAALYDKNLKILIAKIDHTNRIIKSTLGKNPILSQKPFITYHDAFQYFETEQQLNHIDSISYDEETGPGMKHMREIKTKIIEQDIHCLVYQPPRPAIVDSLTNHTSIHATALHPMGSNTNNDVDAWFILMKQLATGFNQCLSR